MLKNKNYIRQVVGIDTSKDILDVNLSVLDDQAVPHVKVSHKFDNADSGVNSLDYWIQKKQVPGVPLQVVMEATGVYHERVAYTLAEKGYDVAIVLPSKIKHFFNSTNIRSVTDKIAAKQIAEFGLIKVLKSWKKPLPVFRTLKLLSREKNMLQEEKSAVINQRHAYTHSYTEDMQPIKRYNDRITFINEQLKEIENEINEIINKKENAWLKDKINLICTTKGLGFKTVLSIVAETDGFNLIQNSRQLVCYSGYDVVFKESGSSVKKKTKISHRGNKFIRKALYFPALVAVEHDPRFAAFFERLFARQQIKMQSYVAVQRKLLILIYTLWKKNEPYNPNFVWTGKAETGSGGNQPVRNNLSDWNGQEGD